MDQTQTFGSPSRGVLYTERRAAYVLIVDDVGRVAMVRAGEKYFLPGGGAAAVEAPEDTIMREAREELARSVRPLSRIGEATQYFYSSTDDCHYRMHAVFFTGEFTDESATNRGEHELEWMPATEAEHVCFHDCHAWAIRLVVKLETADRSTPAA